MQQPPADPDRSAVPRNLQAARSVVSPNFSTLLRGACQVVLVAGEPSLATVSGLLVGGEGPLSFCSPVPRRRARLPLHESVGGRTRLALPPLRRCSRSLRTIWGRLPVWAPGVFRRSGMGRGSITRFFDQPARMLPVKRDRKAGVSRCRPWKRPDYSEDTMFEASPQRLQRRSRWQRQAELVCAWVLAPLLLWVLLLGVLATVLSWPLLAL